MRRAGGIAGRIAGALCRLLPEPFRDAFGAEIEQIFADRWRRAPGPRGIGRRALLVFDLLGSVVREWRDELLHPTPQRRSRPAMGTDLKHLIRWLRRSPLFAMSSIVTLAVGVGVTTAIFAVFHGVLLRPLPFSDPDRIAFITRSGDVSVPDVVDWRERSRNFESFSAMARAWNFDLTGLGDPEPVTAHAVEPDFFRVLGLSAVAGRLFTAADNRQGQPHVVVLTERFWRTRFGSDPAAVGRQLELSGNPTTIIGVAPSSVDFLDDGVLGVVPIAVELPWAVNERGTNNLDAIGRIRPGTAFADASRELESISREMTAEYPRTNRNKIVIPTPLTEFIVAGARPGLVLVLGAVVVLLLIASINLAGLLVARVTSRRRELAVRAALGAGRRRLAAQLLAEGLALGAVGGALGLALAAALLGLLRGSLPASIPRGDALTLGGPVLLFGLAAALAAGLLCGIIPAVRGSRAAPLEGLSSTRGSGERGRFRALRAVVATEVALAVALLAAAGILTKSFVRLWEQPLGFESSGVLTANLVLPEQRYSSFEAQSNVYSRIVARLEETPGITHAGYVTTLPLTARGGIGTRLSFAGRPDIDPDGPNGVRVRPVLGDYFGALRIPIVRGRGFTPADDREAVPVAVINEALARRFWADRDPIGAQIALAWHDFGPEQVWMTVVGVAHDVRSLSLAEGDEVAVYLPYLQRQAGWVRFGDLVVRTAGPPGAFSRALQEAAWAEDPDLALGAIETLAQRRSASVERERVLAVVLGLFAASAVLLVIQGLFGIVSYAVAERRREIGVRMALGAAAPGVVALVTKEALAPMFAGAVAGIAMALLGSRFLAAAVFEVSPTDPVVLGGTVLVTALVALLASAVPAWRASRIDPLEAIRAEEPARRELRLFRRAPERGPMAAFPCARCGPPTRGCSERQAEE